MDIKSKMNKEQNLKLISYISYFILCLSIVAKDYFGVSASINTLPYIANINLSQIDPTVLSVMTFAMHALLYGLWIEILSRFVFNSIVRVSFSDINRYKFISVFKGVVTITNILLSFFNFMYFYRPFTYRLQPVIEMLALSITFTIMYAIFYKKYLNKKSAPVIFLSLAIPLGIYFIFIAI